MNLMDGVISPCNGDIADTRRIYFKCQFIFFKYISAQRRSRIAHWGLEIDLKYNIIVASYSLPLGGVATNSPKFPVLIPQPFALPPSVPR